MVAGQNIFPLVKVLIFIYVKKILQIFNKVTYRNHIKSSSMVENQYAITWINTSSS